MSHLNTAVDKSVTTISGYVASISTAVGGYLSLNNIALLIGIISTLVLSLIQIRRYRLKIKMDHENAKMDREFHRARMKAIAEGRIPDVERRNEQ